MNAQIKIENGTDEEIKKYFMGMPVDISSYPTEKIEKVVSVSVSERKTNIM